MPMGIVSDEEFARQYENVTSQPVSVIPGQDNSSPVTESNAQDSVDISLPVDEITETKCSSNAPSELIDGELVINSATRGRNPGDNNVPAGLRSLIAATHHIEGRSAALDLAKEFGVSSSSVSAYAKGTNSTASYNDPSKKNTTILEFVKKRRARVTKKALSKLTLALDHITEDKLSEADAKDLSSIAKDMSAIVGHMNPESQSNPIGNQVNFVLFAPPVKGEDTYDALPISE